MDKMTGISVFVPEKYRNPEAYEEVTSGIYRKRSENCYCISVAADVIPRYPLRPMMESFWLHFEKGGDVHTEEVDGRKRKVIELLTRDCREEYLACIRNFATIDGKTIVNFYLSGYDMMGVLFGTTNCTVNGKPVEVPLIGARDDLSRGSLNFEMYAPEQQMIVPFTDGSALEFPQISEKAKIRAVMTRVDYLYLVYLEKNVNKAIVFNTQGFFKLIEDEDLVNEVMRGELHNPC